MANLSNESYCVLRVIECDKAIHLELVIDLITQSFSGAPDRMLLRRNNVDHLYSDGVASELALRGIQYCSNN